MILPPAVFLSDRAGHQMLFRDLQGRLRMSLHEDNNNAHLKILTLTE